MKESKSSFFLSIPFIVNLLIAIGALVYYVFYISGKNLCLGGGCLVVGKYLKIKEWILYFLFAIFTWSFLIVLILFDRKQTSFWKNILIFILFIALAFDGTIFGYQVWIIKSLCWSCLGVSISLFIVLFSLYFLRIPKSSLLLGLIIWTIPFVSHSLLEVKVKKIKLQDTVLYSQKTNSTKPYKIFLFFSLRCSHCIHLLTELATQESYDVDINLCCISRDKESLKALSAFLDNPLKLKGNPFKRLLEYMNKRNILKSEKIKKIVKERTKNALLLFISRNFNGVPLMIVKGKDVEVILVGHKRILIYLLSNGILKYKRLKKNK